MPSDESEQRSTSMLGGLLSPLRLPERVIQALESLVDAGQEVAPIREELTLVREQTASLPKVLPAIERIDKQAEQLAEMLPVVERISEQVEPLGELLPALEHLEESLGTRIDSLRQLVGELESNESHLNTTVAKLNGELDAMHETVKALRGDVTSVTDHLPDGTGPLQKAREMFTSGSDDD
ncbi:MAG: hypothetical protein M3Z33_01265 [Actinomycetota bacterium]|nr:hypothetical protein [Actinomycetota bacterium]